jgi:hypothetical protein
LVVSVGVGGKASCLTGLARCRAGSPCPARAPRSRVEWTPNPSLPPPRRNADAAPGKRRGGRGGCVTPARAGAKVVPSILRAWRRKPWHRHPADALDGQNLPRAARPHLWKPE